MLEQEQKLCWCVSITCGALWKAQTGGVELPYQNIKLRATSPLFSAWRSSWKPGCFCLAHRSGHWDRNPRRLSSRLFFIIPASESRLSCHIQNPSEFLVISFSQNLKWRWRQELSSAHQPTEELTSPTTTFQVWPQLCTSYTCSWLTQLLPLLLKAVMTEKQRYLVASRG